MGIEFSFGILVLQLGGLACDLVRLIQNFEDENCLQTFKLPRPVLCIGGILQIELLGRVQKQEMDGLYYICMCYVQVKGQPLPPVFDVEMSAVKTCLLKYCPQTDCSSSPSASGDDANPTSSGGWLALAARIRQSRQLGARVWNRARFLNALLGNVAVVHNEDEVEEGEVRTI